MLNIENNFGQTFPKRGSIIVKRAQRSERSFVLNVCMVKISGNLDLGRLNSPYISESIRRVMLLKQTQTVAQIETYQIF